MRCLLGFSIALLLIQLMCCSTGKAAPHTSTEESDEHGVASTDGKSSMTPGSDHGSHEHQSSHETKSKEDDDDSHSSEESETSPTEEEKDESNEDEPVRFPKTESLCPARPEEITNIEAECAEEYRKWKHMRALKTEVTTCHTTSRSPEVTDAPDSSNSSGEDMTPLERQQLEEMTTIMMDLEETTTDLSMELTTTITSTTTTPFPTTTRPIQRRSSKHKRSRKIIKKRSCYPATCILRKLNLLDGMGQPSIERIQSFAVNMTVDDSTNLEEKAVGCVKEINEAMIDASGDIGKKVGCVAQKVISCLNKGLACPIMNVPQ